MTDKLKLIELIYDEFLVLAAESLFEAGMVSDLIKTESQLYIGKVKDGKLYEVEIQFPFTKKQKVSCECTFYGTNSICKHIVASLFALREDLKKAQNQKQTKQKTGVKKRLSTLSISQILDEISHDDIKSFLKSYGRQDKKFLTNLKVAFAHKIDLVDNFEKYKGLLNSIIGPYTGKKSKMPPADVRALIQVLVEFKDQIQDNISLGQFREAFHIYSTAFAKLEYVQHYSSHQEETLSSLSDDYHSLISLFMSEKLPIELKDDLVSFLKDLACRSYYHYLNANINIVQFLYPKLSNKDKILFSEELVTLLEKKPSAEASILLALIIILRNKYSKAEIDLLAPYPHLVIEIVDHLISSKQYVLALAILKKQNKAKTFSKEVNNRLFFLYILDQNFEKIIQIASIAYQKTGESSYLTSLQKELPTEDYHRCIDAIETTLLSNTTDSEIITKFYTITEKWPELLHYISTIQSLETLQRYDKYLYKHQKSNLILLYQYLISNYLDEHIGDNAAQYIESLFQHFKNNGMLDVAKDMSAYLKDKYGYRTTIAELKV